MQVVDLKQRFDDAIVRRVLSFAVGYPNAQKINGVMQQYESPERRLVGFEEEGKLVGCLGYKAAKSRAVTVTHMAVALDARRRGVGRSMVRWLSENGKCTVIRLETDEDALDFYRKCGFVVERVSDRMMLNGDQVRRYTCVLRLPHKS